VTGEELLRQVGPWHRYVTGTGGLALEELVDDRTDVLINAPRALIATEVQAQLRLLFRLKRAGLLRAPEVEP
jgi:hypothetical protein